MAASSCAPSSPGVLREHRERPRSEIRHGGRFLVKDGADPFTAHALLRREGGRLRERNRWNAIANATRKTSSTVAIPAASRWIVVSSRTAATRKSATTTAIVAKNATSTRGSRPIHTLEQGK